MNVAVTVLLGLSFLVDGATITVGQTGLEDYSGIQAAVDAAADGDEIVVGPGAYEVELPIDFNWAHDPSDPDSPPVKNLVLRSEKGPGETTIRMAATPLEVDYASVAFFGSGEDASSRLEGFTIEGGTGTMLAFDDGSAFLCGGGVACLDSRPTIADCVIRSNYASLGGGVYGSPSLIGCTIASNVTEICWHGVCGGGYGGGVYGDGTLTSCIIRGNDASSGGGVDGAPVLTGCTIVGNRAETVYVDEQYYDGYGGGIDGAARATNCVIAGNRAVAGGGVYGSAVLAYCTVAGNVAEQFCAVECVGGEGGAAYCDDSSAPAFLGCIAWANSPESVCAELTDCLVDGDPLFVDPGTFDFTGTVDVDIGQYTYPLPDFIVAEPDYHLRAGSPAIDAGVKEGAPADDLEGRPRPCQGGIDLGAYEFGVCGGAVPFRRGDADGNGAIDLTDAIYVLSYQFLGGQPPACLAAGDVDGSGVIDLTDAIYLLSYQFLGGAPPPAPFPDCGVADSPPDCGSFDGCP